MSAAKAVFVLIHGGWHNHSAWDRVTPILKANGFEALTLDLPGAGVNAIAPAFAAERSPIAGRDAGGADASRSRVGKRSCVTQRRQGHPGRALGWRDDSF